MAAVNDEDNSEVILQKEIDHLLQERAKLEEIYASVRTCEALPSNQEHIAKYLLTRKLSLLKAEIEVRKCMEVAVLPESFECLMQEITKSVRELRATAADLKTEKKRLEAKIQIIQELVDREEQFQRAVNKKIQELPGIPDGSKESRERTAIARLRKVRVHLDKITEEMMSFIEHHFPPPTAREIAQQTQGLPLHHVADGREMQSMSKIVQSLVNEWKDHRHDCYVSTQAFWSPYLELLLRMGVAERHTHDPNLVRLQDFT